MFSKEIEEMETPWKGHYIMLESGNRHLIIGRRYREYYGFLWWRRIFNRIVHEDLAIIFYPPILPPLTLNLPWSGPWQSNSSDEQSI